MSQEFEWDDAKARRNARRHRVAFDEAATVFSDSQAVVLADSAHSAKEARYVILGISAAGRALVVAFTERGRTIRIITAHRATRHERQSYEQA
ncbi:MAG: BrnT family toxin [Candidatus Limnocylindria bacterium]